jgi:hypothetical protein
MANSEIPSVILLFSSSLETVSGHLNDVLRGQSRLSIGSDQVPAKGSFIALMDWNLIADWQTVQQISLWKIAFLPPLPIRHFSPPFPFHLVKNCEAEIGLLLFGQACLKWRPILPTR